jgi:hypothetical protein
VFAWLRPNDLIWNYWVNDYLLGRKPPPFDILFWNADTTRMTAALHRDFLQMGVTNGLARPGGVTMLGSPVDLAAVDRDTYLVAGITDHLCPWQSCYRSTQLLSGSKRFVLSTSGHIAAMVNPPGNEKARYQEGQDCPEDPQEWLRRAENCHGSWWPDYTSWLAERSGEDIAAPTELGHERADVLGISWGGGLAQQFALSRPDRVRRLVLVATGTGALMVPGHPRVLAKMLTPRRHRNPGYAAQIAGELYGGSARRDPAVARDLLHLTSRLGPARGYYYQLLSGIGWTSLPRLRRLRRPTLILPGMTTRSSRWSTRGSCTGGSRTASCTSIRAAISSWPPTPRPSLLSWKPFLLPKEPTMTQAVSEWLDRRNSL